MAKDIGFSVFYFNQIEREDNCPPSDNAVKAIANYFKLDYPDLVVIGTQCKNPIDCFLYLQKIGRI